MVNKLCNLSKFYNFFMGNLQSNYGQEMAEWEVISQQNKFLPGKPTLCKSKKTKIVVEQFFIDIPIESSSKQELKLYDKRQSSMSGHLVNVIAANRIENSLMCSPVNQPFDVKTEYIPWRFHKFTSLTQEEALYFLKGIFSACQELLYYTRTPFHLIEPMVGLNSRGVVKVWLNSNFALNKIEKKTNQRDEELTERDMVFSAIEMVSKKIYPDKEFKGNANYQLKSGWKADFSMKKIIVEKYLNKNMQNVVKNKILKKLSGDKFYGLEQKHEEKTSITNIKSWLLANSSQRRPFSNITNESEEEKKNNFFKQFEQRKFMPNSNYSEKEILNNWSQLEEKQLRKKNEKEPKKKEARIPISKTKSMKLLKKQHLNKNHERSRRSGLVLKEIEEEYPEIAVTKFYF